MKNLTAEKCREMFLHLLEDKRQDGITLKEDLYMQALEIALPILEQQERGEGWIEWCGGRFNCGEIPVPEDTPVEVKGRAGKIGQGLAGWLRWYHLGGDHDIIAYRVVK